MMKKIIALTSAICGSLIIGACAPKTTLIDFNNVPDTPHCQSMKDICKEAEDFQRQFQSMTAEERQDAKTILNAYIQQCADTQVMCKKSAK
jgi:hypothetical protein